MDQKRRRIVRHNTQDKTIERNYISKWQYMIRDYELIKSRKHAKFRFVSDFYKFHKTNRQTFLKYYHRYLSLPEESSLIPQKRGPKWRVRRRDCSYIEEEVLELRRNGVNRYEVCYILNPLLRKRGQKELSPSKVYRIFKKNGMNRLRPKMKENKRKIIKEKAGELAHIDCHYLSRDLIVSETKRYYLVSVIDDCTRVAWADVVEDVKSLTVMFSTMRILSVLGQRYCMKFLEQWIYDYNHRAPHSSLGMRAPVEYIKLTQSG